MDRELPVKKGFDVPLTQEIPVPAREEIPALTFASFGQVELKSFMGGDDRVVEAARVSFNQDAKETDGLRKNGLIRFLLINRHGSPFEHSWFTFVIECPIFVHREWLRHRVGPQLEALGSIPEFMSINEWSGRYSTLLPKFWLPDPQAVRTQVGKPGAYSFEPLSTDATRVTIDLLMDSHRQAYSAYQMLLSLGVAKELARTCLPVAIYTRFYWTVNARALMNWLSLRNAPEALREIREYAKQVEPLFQRSMPITYKHFVEHGRLAP